MWSSQGEGSTVEHQHTAHALADAFGSFDRARLDRLSEADRASQLGARQLLLPSADFADDGVVHDAHARSQASSLCWRPDRHTAGEQQQQTSGNGVRRGGAAAPLPLLGALGACGAGRLALDSQAPA